MKPSRFFLCCLIAFPLISCARSVPVKPEPEWLTVNKLRPGETISLVEKDANICFRIMVGDLIEKGDFWKLADVVERTNILIDNKSAVILIDTSNPGQVSVWLTERGKGVGYGNPSDVEQDPIIAQAINYDGCVATDHSVGVHTAKVSFKQTSGKIASYEWSFEFINGTLPTSTSLPTASVVNELPDYLEGVFPLPGEKFKMFTDVREFSNSMLRSRGIMIPFITKNLSQQPVCVILALNILKKYGDLPKEGFPLESQLERIHMVVDEKQYSWESYFNYTADNGRSQCVLIPTSVGKHTATLYIEFLDKKLLIYSWSFKFAK